MPNRTVTGAIILSASSLALAFSAPARAEVARAVGDFPADYRDVSLLHSLGVDRIGGQDGPALSHAIEERLLEPGPDGRPYYDVVGLSRFSDPRTARPQGVISGFTKVDVNERKVQREKEQCTEKSNGNCTKKEKVKVDCTERRIDLTTTLRVADTKDGAILYTQSRPQTDTTSWCPDERPWRTTEKAIDDMIGKAAKKFAKDITPTRESYSVRLREEREGMDKDLGKRFKDSVKLSQRDWQAACGIWRGMDGELPNQPSLLFNLGLCAEVSGDYKSADALYRRAAGTGIRDGAFADAIDRVAKLTVGREDARVRGGR